MSLCLLVRVMVAWCLVGWTCELPLSFVCVCMCVGSSERGVGWEGVFMETAEDGEEGAQASTGWSGA